VIRNAVETQSGRGERGTEPRGCGDANLRRPPMNALGPQAQRRYFPTPKGIIAAGQPTGIPVTSGGCADGSSVVTLVP